MPGLFVHHSLQGDMPVVMFCTSESACDDERMLFYRAVRDRVLRESCLFW